MTVLLEIKNLYYQEQQQHILQDISLKLAAGELIAVIGPNGAGKSTLLKLILGINKASKGSVKITKKTKIGYVPQKLAVTSFLPLTTLDFLKLNQKSVQQNLIVELKLEKLLKKNLHHLSGGELQRVLLCRSLHGQPNLVLLDEPDQNLDINSQLEFFNLLHKLHNQYKFAVILVSHNLHMVLSKTSKVYCLNRHICCSGTAEALSEDPKFIEIFGKNYANNFSFYKHQHDHTH